MVLRFQTERMTLPLVRKQPLRKWTDSRLSQAPSSQDLTKQAGTPSDHGAEKQTSNEEMHTMLRMYEAAFQTNPLRDDHALEAARAWTRG